jgi:outer membrane biosynthesis protein TonB
MAGEGFDTGGAGDPGASDPGRAAREAADRIAQQVRDILQTAEQRAVDIRSRAQHDADEIRENAAGAAARMLERVDELEQQIDSFMREFFGSIRSEVRGLAPLEDIDAAAAGAQQPQPEPEPEADPEPEPVEAEPQREAPPRPFEEPQGGEEPEEAEEPRRRRGLLWGRREREPDGPEGAEPEPAGAESVAESSEDAHVMALNMALNGTPRDETESYLVQRFGSFGGLESILDDVYGRIKPS